ncbi:MAG: helix-turn-helix domain-containing protein [Firmicutes bacterium]|nr:helix-turn-helix domain-containing protein [Bacillota bacterium]
MKSKATDWDGVPLLLTVRELQELFGFPRDFSYKLMHVRGRRIGGKLMIRKETLKEFLEENPLAA